MAALSTFEGVVEQDPTFATSAADHNNTATRLPEPAAYAAPDNGLVVKEGDTVIFDVNNDKCAFLRVKASGKVKVGRTFCSMAPLVGTPFGSIFELSPDGQELVRSSGPPHEDWGEAVTAVERNNAQLQDKGCANQKLSAEDIAAMKQAGQGGSAIIQALTANSATYETKTEFAQEKYRKRKAKKYCLYATIIRPTARSICEAYLAKTPARICGLRTDTLAIMLSLANVGAHAKVLVLETCAGLVAGAAVERLGGYGTVCCTYCGDKAASLDAVRSFNFTAQVQSTVVSALLPALLAAAAARGSAPATQAAELVLGSGAAAAETSSDADGAQLPASDAAPCRVAEDGADTLAQAGDADGPQRTAHLHEVTASAPTTQPGAVQSDEASAQAQDRLQNGVGASAPDQAAVGADQRGPSAPVRGGTRQGLDRATGGVAACASQQQLAALSATGFTSCIVAAPSLQPMAALSALMPLLAPSASFVVFHPYAQPLAEAMHALQVAKKAVALQLQESWLRPYQVLPQRTHPQMTCSGTGGFLLSGTHTTPSPAPPQAAAGAPTKRGRQQR